MAEAVRQLKALGFTILMDDFGSGYSSLNMLKDITVDVLKIDMGFLNLSLIHISLLDLTREPGAPLLRAGTQRCRCP